MANMTESIPPHRILRDIYRNYELFKDYVANTGNHVIEHGYYTYNEDGSIKTREIVTISFWDLHKGLAELSPRKAQAVYHNVIRDKKQKEVADEMGITTVSVGQYVQSAMESIARDYFAEQITSEKVDRD